MLDSLSTIEKITWTLGKSHHSETEDDSRNYLETPRNSKRSETVNVGATELDEVLEENAPCDRPGYPVSLLQFIKNNIDESTILGAKQYGLGFQAQ